MPSDVDPRLVKLLRASLGFADALRDAGVEGEIAVRLARAGGLRVLTVVAGSGDPTAEEFSQRNQPVGQEHHSLPVAGLSFQWPKHDWTRTLRPVNDNGTAPPARYGFEEETPALR